MNKKLLPLFSLFLAGAGLAHAKKEPVARLAAEVPYFSPNNNGVQDTLALKLMTSGVKGIKTWEIQFQEATGVSRKTISGLDDLPESVVWNGQDDFGAPAPEGAYTAYLKIWTKKGAMIVANPLSFTLDLTPPTLSLNAPSRRIVKRGGTVEPATFNFSAADLTGIGPWRFQLLDEGRSEIFSYASTAPLPAAWTLNLPAETPLKGSLTAILSVTDLAGNNASSPPLQLETVSPAQEPLAPAVQQPVPPELPAAETKSPTAPPPAAVYDGPFSQMTLILSLADLFGGDAVRGSVLTENGRSLLARAAGLLLESPYSRATIIGHVDARETAKEARELSSYFAWRVFSSLVKDRGVEKSSLSVKGLGADIPISDNRTRLGRSRNRRIEIQIFLPKPRE